MYLEKEKQQVRELLDAHCAFGVGEGIQAAAGAVIGSMAGGNTSKSAPAATIGQVQQVTERNFFLDGWDVEVEWRIQNEDGEVIRKAEWHEAKHLIEVQIESM